MQRPVQEAFNMVRQAKRHIAAVGIFFSSSNPFVYIEVGWICEVDCDVVVHSILAKYRLENEFSI